MNLKRYFLSALFSLFVVNAGMASATSIESAGLQSEDAIAESESLLAQAEATTPEDFFEQAKQELPEDYYALYRVLERIARANELDNLPWRLHVSPEYNVNAFATDVNLIAFFSGLLDQVDGDPHAIACVVGHEMAHHTKNHIAVGNAEKERILQQLRAEAVEEVAAEEEDLREDLQELNTGEWVTSGAGSLADSLISGDGGLIGTGINIIGGILRGNKERRIRQAIERIDTIYKEKEAERLAEWQELNHNQEFEADEVGYTYMVRAGFNPQGCLTVMEVLKRLGVTESATHPATPERIEALEGFASKYPTQVLVNEGKANLAARSMPLTYEISRDGATLRVNSQAGSGNFDDAFPE
ncbi:M48 family metalloprotease [Spirulina sp. CS-785/01]|uniref:M48 family metallopeptidase n=1 Tax=Spirulina sp. CS-785/01 TaxID=3021716 RepID=UPI00232CB59F|nr:M48 family metallopeptidase [Spirulina sp. CS-785/01]MDB9315728.1 M48 family metalloprotease [Spirulina sp. CS-785/01]